MIKLNRTMSLALVAAALVASGCRPKKPAVAPHVDTAQSTQSSAPSVDMTTPTPAPTTQPSTKVDQTDFVNEEPKATSEVLPSDLDQLNQLAQEKGYIQDAFFGYDESALSADAQSALSNSASWLKQHPSYNVLIEGHTDERGTEQYNLALGDHRANTAKEYLATLGVDSSRMRTVSYGLERPFDPGHSEDAWAKNRRAHLVLVGR
jgi:peptidoglycan-associated lipoprotein